MLAKAEAKYVRISARKARLVSELVKGKTVEEAAFILKNVNKRAGGPIQKVISSAFSNANNAKQEKLLSKEVLITAIRINGGPMLKRYRAATMGRATSIRHRTAHIYIELDKKVEEKKRKKKGRGA
ncbi:MAG: 50S ribosomal protein L22 [Candidatus Omnitrophica bacterium]|nr:50S ribosomal protein L22 [Candidatus Omnitrophota bacterium]